MQIVHAVASRGTAVHKDKLTVDVAACMAADEMKWAIMFLDKRFGKRLRGAGNRSLAVVRTDAMLVDDHACNVPLVIECVVRRSSSRAHARRATVSGHRTRVHGEQLGRPRLRQAEVHRWRAAFVKGDSEPWSARTIRRRRAVRNP